jgi:hypothetical protein
MTPEEARKLKPDTPLSLTDGAPRVVTLNCGVTVRIPAAMDFRIVANVADAMGDGMDAVDNSVLMLYCAMHTTRADIRRLWEAARKPKALYDAVMLWMAAMDAAPLIAAMNELSAFSRELEADSDGDDTDEDTGKKKTGSR